MILPLLLTKLNYFMKKTVFLLLVLLYPGLCDIPGGKTNYFLLECNHVIKRGFKLQSFLFYKIHKNCLGIFQSPLIPF